jgi:hypothetical protein
MATNELATWEQANDAYIGAALEWLRLLLAHHAPNAAPSMPIVPFDERSTPRASMPPPAQPAQPPPWWTFRRTTPGAAPPSVLQPPPSMPRALPPMSNEVTAEQVAEAAQRLRATESTDPQPAMLLLARRLGLSEFERDLLLLAVAMEFDTRIPALCARAQDDPSRAFPTYALALTIFEHPSWDALSPDRPLRFFRLIDIVQSSTQPLTSSPLRADERVVNYVKGLSHLDDRIAPFVMPLGDPVHDDELPESQRAIVEEMLWALQHDQPRLQPLQLLGPDPESKQLVARAAAHRLGLGVYRIAADMLPQQAADLETLARLWQREALLLPLALYIEASDLDRSSETHATPLKRFLARADSVVFVDARETWPVPRGTHSFDVDKPLPHEQRELWTRALSDQATEEAALLASQFNLSAAAIDRISTEALAGDAEVELGDRLWDRAAHHTRMHIDALAQRIDAKATWDDIVLPPQELELLRQIAAHVAERGTVYDEWGFRARMNRGFGISALFAGASGTGKTMAAEVIANELGLSLHRIDLSSVVSKWVGETEKNLEKLFRAADDSNGILFFDEADALFGKRTDVQHSQDRFANIEINFLLQRLESYRGLAVLATNLKDALDKAFLRRLRFIVNFPFPGPGERRSIWEKVFPPETPLEELDFDHLARLNLTGGSVHNIALASAFLAANRGTAVTMATVLESAKTELRKIEKPVTDADFEMRDRKDERRAG